VAIEGAPVSHVLAYNPLEAQFLAGEIYCDRVYLPETIELRAGDCVVDVGVPRCSTCLGA